MSERAAADTRRMVDVPLRPGGIDLLLVEDSPPELELERIALAGLQSPDGIAIARDGEEALLLLHGPQALRPRLVILDLKLPKVGGADVLERVKAEPQTHAVPVVVFTSSDDANDIERCYALGANGYVIKPLDFQRFQDAVKMLYSYWMGLNVATSEPARR